MAALPLRLFHGVWRRNDDGHWIFDRKPTDLGYTLLVKRTETIEGLQTLVRERYNLSVETPLVMAYHPAEWLLEPEGTRTPPTTLESTAQVQTMIGMRSWYPGLTLCVSSGPDDVAYYDFLCETTYTIGGATFVFDGYSKEELVASKEILEEVFNEQDLVVMYRTHLEMEKAKEARREMGGSSGGSSPPLGGEGSGSAPPGPEE